jgi:hypothetical protein
MIQKVALGSFCSGIALAIALWSNNKAVQVVAVATGSCLASFSATTIAIEQHRIRKSRTAHADLYVELLRQMNHQPPPSRPQRPKACQGCCFYHGVAYGGQQLICGMHPYGVEDDYCGDWEGQEAEALDS